MECKVEGTTNGLSHWEYSRDGRRWWLQQFPVRACWKLVRVHIFSQTSHCWVALRVCMTD